MHCENCGDKYETAPNYCGSCGSKMGKNLGSINISGGIGNVNVGVGNLPNANIHIGDKIVGRDNPIEYQMGRSSNVKLPIKAFWAFISGAVGFITAFLDLLSNLGFKTWISESFEINPLLIPISFVFLFLSLMLFRQKFVWFQFFGLEIGNKGYIRFTRLKGRCPKCNSTLKVRLVGPSGAQQYAALCQRNPEHRFTFDPTELPEISD